MNQAQDGGDADLLAEAAAWFARLRNDDADADEWLAFDRWLEASPAHLQAYEQVERAWIGIEDAPAPLREVEAPVRGVRRRRTWLGAGVALAACAAGAVYLGPSVWAPNAPTIQYTAPAGAARDIRLADGTQIQLRPGSSLSVRLERDSRQVVLGDAEAVFDVAHDTRRPFVITAGDTSVRVVGTRFDLRRRSGQIVLSVSRGAVEVRHSQAAAPLRVAAGQRLKHTEGADHATVGPADADADFAWLQRRLIYRGATLSAIAADLSRDLGVPVRVADEATGARTFTGVLNLDSPDVVLQRLSGLADVKVRKDGDGYLLKGR